MFFPAVGEEVLVSGAGFGVPTGCGGAWAGDTDRLLPCPGPWTSPSNWVPLLDLPFNRLLSPLVLRASTRHLGAMWAWLVLSSLGCLEDIFPNKSWIYPQVRERHELSDTPLRDKAVTVERTRTSRRVQLLPTVALVCQAAVLLSREQNANYPTPLARGFAPHWPQWLCPIAFIRPNYVIRTGAAFAATSVGFVL